jgi:hypothetical protein
MKNRIAASSKLVRTQLVSIPIADSCMRDIAAGPTCTEKSVAVSGYNN